MIIGSFHDPVIPKPCLLPSTLWREMMTRSKSNLLKLRTYILALNCWLEHGRGLGANAKTPMSLWLNMPRPPAKTVVHGCQQFNLDWTIQSSDHILHIRALWLNMPRPPAKTAPQLRPGRCEAKTAHQLGPATCVALFWLPKQMRGYQAVGEKSRCSYQAKCCVESNAETAHQLGPDRCPGTRQWAKKAGARLLLRTAS